MTPKWWFANRNDVQKNYKTVNETVATAPENSKIKL